MPDQQQTESVIVEVSTRAYPISAIQRAIYWLADRAAGRVEPVDQDRARIVLEPSPGNSPGELERALWQSLTDFALRVEIETQTKELRTAITTAAISGLISKQDKP